MFYTERRLVALTGLRARNLDELESILRVVPGSAVFYHTHHMYLAHHFETPVFTNDFASWVGEALQDHVLAEKLAAIDLMSFTTIRSLRERILVAISEEARRDIPRSRNCPPGDEFYFCRSKSFILPTGIVVRTPSEFFEQIPGISNDSLFFHFFEARLRLEHTTNDFSQWLAWLGCNQLADSINKLDPYAVSLDELKRQIATIGQGWEGE